MGICVMLSYCATPISPTGGPSDEQPPQILKTEPKTGTTNFAGQEIIIHFDDFVDRGSFQQALRVEPSFGLEYDINWGRSSLAIEFQNELPDSTTFIINISTEFADLNGNSLDAPIKIALSTGPTIDEGKIAARILDARTGETRKAERVLLYRLPADLTKPANYIAETDTSGVVRFSYLREGDYLAFWVDDRNRNGIWNKKSERAQPFKIDTLSLEKSGADTLGTLFIAKSDTAEPTLGGVGLFSTQRLRLRFNENISLTDSTKITVTDTTGTFYANAYSLYRLPDQLYILFVQSKKKLKQDNHYQLHVQHIVDEAGNQLAEAGQHFTGSSQKDTTAQRIIDSASKKGIYPDGGIEITYAKKIDKKSAIRDSVVIVTADTAYSQWEHLRITQNKLWIYPENEWEEGINYEVRIWAPLKEDYKKITPNIWFESTLGALDISFVDTTSKAVTRPTRLILKNKEGVIVGDTTFTGKVTIDDLAPIQYTLILYQDLNHNGQWDAGRVKPYKAPEPYYIRTDVPVKKSFTSELEVTFDHRSAIPDEIKKDSSNQEMPMEQPATGPPQQRMNQ